jgi:hypothetical protein
VRHVPNDACRGCSTCAYGSLFVKKLTDALFKLFTIAIKQHIGRGGAKWRFTTFHPLDLRFSKVSSEARFGHQLWWRLIHFLGFGRGHLEKFFSRFSGSLQWTVINKIWQTVFRNEFSRPPAGFFFTSIRESFIVFVPAATAVMAVTNVNQHHEFIY